MWSMRILILLAGAAVCSMAHSALITATDSNPVAVDALNEGFGGVSCSPPYSKYCTATRTVSLGQGAVQDVNATVTWHKGSFFGESFFILSHTGIDVVLLAPFQADCLSGDGECPPGQTFTVTFDDQASEPIPPDHLESGTFKPTQPLSAFQGLNALGDWTLTIGDADSGGATVYSNFTLLVRTVPEPSSIALLTLALGCLFWRLRYSR